MVAKLRGGFYNANEALSIKPESLLW
jgi:hypothetical protein